MQHELRTQGKNQLLVAATAPNVSLTAELKSQNATEGGITLGAKNLYELIANAPGEEVTVKKAEPLGRNAPGEEVTVKKAEPLDRNAPGDEVTVKKPDNHWAEIKSGKVRYRIVRDARSRLPRFRIIPRRGGSARPRARARWT